MKLTASVNGAERALDEIPAEIDLIELGPGVYSALVGARSLEIFLESAGDGVFRASINGRVHQIELRDPRRYVPAGGAGSDAGAQTIKAQMPGKVVEVLVAEGDEVQAGQGLLVIEAMKMQNEIRAPRAGRLVSIPIAPGDSVETGRALAVLE